MERAERRVVVVGDDDRTAKLRTAIRDLGWRVGDIADANPPADAIAAVVAVGERAVRDVLVDAPAAPVIPVGQPRFALDVADAERCARRLFDDYDPARDDGDQPSDGLRRVTHPILAVDSEGGSGSACRAAFDVALVTDEPARISEFAVSFPEGGTESFRADGAVVATPLGSDAYANAAGGAVVEPGGGLSVVPIAPFSTHTDAWVAADRATLSVERETEPVSLVVDGTKRRTVAPHRAIEIEAVERVEIVVSAATASRRARRSETL
ncbi:ATP-NAD kinase [Halorubrum trueperi]|uniref:ATP-NAD kinase n=1 Tax=Halorubrum trueperi TaxID=2004704 RepID=A0ABD5UJZ1_9EURY